MGEKKAFGAGEGAAGSDVSGVSVSALESMRKSLDSSFSVRLDQAVYNGITGVGRNSIKFEALESMRKSLDSSFSVRLDPAVYNGIMGVGLNSVTVKALESMRKSLDSSFSVHLDPAVYNGIMGVGLNSVTVEALESVRKSLDSSFSVRLDPQMYTQSVSSRGRCSPPALDDTVRFGETNSASQRGETDSVSIVLSVPPKGNQIAVVSVIHMTVAYRMLHCFETRLRKLIADLMEAYVGPDWIRRRVSPQIVADWEEKKAKAQDRGFVVGSLLDYADFTHYRCIIFKKDNWREVFQPIFGNQKDTEISFERLEPLRVETMHNRALSASDAGVLAIELNRLMQKIDRCSLVYPAPYTTN